MKNKYAIIGGDERLLILKELFLKDGFNVSTYALDNETNSLEEAISNAEYIISSVPLTKDNINVNTPLSDKMLSLKQLKEKLKNKKFIAGKIPNIIKEDISIKSYDLLDIEQYAILNAIATAEGAIQIAMEQTSRTLSGSNVLIMGFGRIGKVIAKMLQGIGAIVYCEARKSEDLAYIKAYGYNAIDLKNLDENLSKFDIIINNIPTLILDKRRIDLLKKDVYIIDLASNPGGTDFEYAKLKNIKTTWALALPGKCAPVSAAEYIRDTIYSIEMKEREENKK